MHKSDTICALATAYGQSGIGVIRVTGPLSKSISKKILHQDLQPRYAYYGSFFDNDNNLIDKGVAIAFPGPNSYTGEDVVEFQGHGGVSVIRKLLATIISLDVRVAEPGEFTKRAFLNGKMDLVQAEAVQDLIQSSSEESALSAVRSLTGEFSEKINQILSKLISLRVFVEATIDFSDEEIDFLESHEVSSKLYSLKLTLLNILESANQGAILRDGIHVAIAGKPNAGKSSLLNSLTKQPSAIVTDVAGTTRDVLKETIQIDGMPIHIIDTAGLHNSDNIIEQEGIRRAHTEINNADVVLLVYDASDKSVDLSILPESVKDKPKIVIKNKIDLTGSKTVIQNIQNNPEISISAKNGDGINIVRKALADFAGLNSNTEGVFLARKRHIIAINETLSFINSAISQLDGGASELVAEDLRQAGMHLGQITGEFSSDDLLGQIFSSFCIGK
ncbi:tRNA uridine-5-carboxymethylaminomethyl(34) synthesis GTPase MnmE [Candidatus Pseudothioglobus singularis]|nr:tRNA uridine-5-carboxymethylaminomethyl(34) synthesis GTPase MnmE [Candidatus Pseudothioglobus singularis]MDB4597666.1 tRNA uridine-5-carboxymethylaminomethyl(34) synthesis GTPase MnmE [Candidatus Pseudothioglobus singularis]